MFIITETSKSTGEPTMLENGATVISYTEKDPGGNGWKRHGVALCQWHDEFVTWFVYEDRMEDGVQWNAEAGSYFPSIVEAAADYADRGGR